MNLSTIYGVSKNFIRSSSLVKGCEEGESTTSSGTLSSWSGFGVVAFSVDARGILLPCDSSLVNCIDSVLVVVDATGGLGVRQK